MGEKNRLWNKNFAILWQGQLISDFGNAAFSVALGFWVLEMTKTPALPAGNMALMGIIEACFALPAVLLGPIAGAFVDRHDRKRIIVAADLIRGVLFAAMGILSIAHTFPFWAIYPLAILAGACGAFFGPAISSSIPDIVPLESLSKANSARSLSSTATQLLGNSLGGLLYAMLTAPVLVLINGISFLYAAITQLFMRISPIAATDPGKHLFRDIMEGMKYTFHHRGLRALVLINMVIGFFSTIIITLLTPMFKITPGFGVERFGYVMGTMMVGAVIGVAVLSVVKVASGRRALLFCVCQFTVASVAVLMGFVRNAIWLYPIAFAVGLCNAVIGVLLQTVLQVTIPQENRGKVFGILGTVTGAFAPVAMAASGIIASMIGVRVAFISCCIALLLLSFPFLFSRHFRDFLNTDVSQTVAETASSAI